MLTVLLIRITFGRRARRLKKQVTLWLEVPTLAYFKDLAEETGIPYPTLNHLLLRDCAQSRRRIS